MPGVAERVRKALEGEYDVERELVGGGMARVFIARDIGLDRTVVVKVLPPDLAAGVSAERFRREIMTVSQLQHPHIVPILRAGEFEGIPYFVMPYIEGESLATVLAAGSTLPVALTVRILKDVARALAFAHQRGIVHRDIKPGNILLSAGSATVTDFGVSKALSSARRSSGDKGDNANLTNTGMSLGTLLYMAPEQAAGDPNVDGRADLYSLGATAYQMLTGSAPFANLSPRAMLAARLTKRPPAISKTRRDVPAALERLVMRCLATDPEDRPESAASLVDDLENPNLAVTGEVFSGQIWSTMARRRKTVALAIVAVLTVAASGTYIGIKTNPSAAAEGQTPGSPLPSTMTIAVLPFASTNVNAAEQAIANGLTNAVAARLAHQPGLKVLTPTRSAAEMLISKSNATNKSQQGMLFVEGAVERDGKSLRVMVRLSHAGSGEMVWGDVFDHQDTQLFALQDDVSSGVIAAVAPGKAPVPSS
ncbi:MAG TPA: serine/threonine-protein kinase [Gemmatimonadaceae bacterium]|nr:serine/threonine-protein kinase [Gemmatimonadaceae bacterium]